MTVINPCDYNQTKAATLLLLTRRSCLLRFGRPVVPVFIPKICLSKLEKEFLQEGTDVTIVATGHLVWESLLAADELERRYFL
jgi:transketolase